MRSGGLGLSDILLKLIRRTKVSSTSRIELNQGMKYDESKAWPLVKTGEVDIMCHAFQRLADDLNPRPCSGSCCCKACLAALTRLATTSDCHVDTAGELRVGATYRCATLLLRRQCRSCRLESCRCA